MEVKGFGGGVCCLDGDNGYESDPLEDGVGKGDGVTGDGVLVGPNVVNDYQSITFWRGS